MVDYSKWRDIEISDDEDDTHPNIDTPSLFRWRHQARMERMEEMKKEREKLDARKIDLQNRLKAARDKAAAAPADEAAKKLLADLEEEAGRIKREDEEFSKREKKMPWNVDTISKPGFAKTIINKPAPRPKQELSEQERERRMKQFVKDNEKLLKEFGMMRKYDDSRRFLLEHPALVCEDTANYLVIFCINLEMEEKHELMAHVAHQCICMQYILELSKQLDVDPRSCVSSFFTRIAQCDVEYRTQFEAEVKSFKERIQKRAQEKIAEALREQEEEERQARLGPGGLDPVEVFETLPEELQKCFETRDVSLLQEAIAKMSKEDATYHMKRCVDSGLWVPDAKAAGGDEAGATAANETEEDAQAGSFKKEEAETAAAAAVESAEAPPAASN